VSSGKDTWEEHFKSDETALIYDRQTGGVTKAISDDVVSQYLKSDSLEGKIVLDNACGTGVATKQLRTHTTNLKIEAEDLAEPVIADLKVDSAWRSRQCSSHECSTTIIPAIPIDNRN